MLEFDVTAANDPVPERTWSDMPSHWSPLPDGAALARWVSEWAVLPGDPSSGILLGLLDIDHLDDMRESRGMDYVERFLQTLVGRLQRGLPTAGLLFELQPGRYAVGLPTPPITAAVQLQDLAARIIDLAAVPLLFEGTQVFPCVSLGWSWAAAPVPTQALLRAALSALREARPTGPGAWRFAAMPTDEAAQGATRLDLEASLRQAILHQAAGGTLSLVYQPQVDLLNGRMTGVEALLRWEHPVYGKVSPDQFIPIAERTGLIVHLGAWVLHSACAQAMSWLQQGLPAIRVAVNLSAYQLRHTDIVAEIQAALLASHLPPDHLGVEVTESMLLEDIASVSNTLKQIRSLGVEIALDDFGTGYSSLAYLRQLPIDVIKVDRSFVHDVTAATQDVSITRAIITMAHSLHMKVLAEGVETAGQLALLVANHCDLIQGYFFSRPVPADEVAEMLRVGKHLNPDQVQRAHRARTLLLVDDEDNILAALKRLVRRDGYTILTANGGSQALQRLAENEVDVIVSDQRMPGMTGVEFLRRAKELYPDTVRMVLSGYTELTSITDAINEGAIYKFLTKPWDDERLRAHIAEAFVHKEMVDENRRLGQEVQDANRELAEVNDRLQRLLGSQRERLHREGQSLGMARELLESIPAPVIGFDIEGVIAFMNTDAVAIFDDAAISLGQMAVQVLSPVLIEVWRQASEQITPIDVGGRPYQVVCRTILSPSGSRGKLMILTPRSAVPDAGAALTVSCVEEGSHA